MQLAHEGDLVQCACARYSIPRGSTSKVSVYRIELQETNQKATEQKRGGRAHADQSEPPPTQIRCGPSSPASHRRSEGHVVRASTIKGLAADLTTVALALICTCVVASVEVLPLGRIGDRIGLGGGFVVAGRRRCRCQPPHYAMMVQDISPAWMVQRQISREEREGEAAVDLRSPPTARCACDADGLPKISGTCDGRESRLRVMLFLHPTDAQSRCATSSYSPFECFAPFLRSGYRCRPSRARRYRRGCRVLRVSMATGANTHGWERVHGARRATEGISELGWGRGKGRAGPYYDWSGIEDVAQGRTDATVVARTDGWE